MGDGDGSGPRRRALELRLDEHVPAANVWSRSAQALPQGDEQGVLVRRSVGLSTPRLLRSHVPRRSDDDVLSGEIEPKPEVVEEAHGAIAHVDAHGVQHEVTVRGLYSFDGLTRTSVETVEAGDLCGVHGIEEIGIGDSLTDLEVVDPLDPIAIDEPTMSIVVQVNDSPFAGRDGKYVTSRHLLALAGLQSGIISSNESHFCRGYYTLPGRSHRYRDWKPEGHGPVDINDAISQSCDVYFYEISQDIGIDNMHDYLDRFGLGQKTGIDVIGERPGLVPSREWKRTSFKNRDDQRWYNGETVIASIGQGYMLATPLQLAVATATLANRGVHYRPHMVAAIENPLSGERTLTAPERMPDVDISNSFYWDNVLDAMHDVLQGPQGTARAVGSGAPYEMAGKSGTAQVISIAHDEEYDEEELLERQRDHALFISFAPFDAPRIAVAVIVENGSSGSGVAAPIARAIMDQYLGYGDDAAE